MTNPMTSNTRVAALRHLHDKLKSGEYDGTDVMAAWIAVEDLACLLEKQSEPPPAGQEPRSFAPWRVPDPPRTDAVEALRPFVELFEKSNERYRKRGGDPDQFADSHPFREITARELPLGVWRRAQAAMRAPSPPAVALVTEMREWLHVLRQGEDLTLKGEQALKRTIASADEYLRSAPTKETSHER